MAESRAKNSAKNAVSGLISRIITLILSFGSRTVFISILGEECLGLNGLFTTLLSLFSLAELGIGQAITFYLYKPIAEENNNRLAQLVKFYKLSYRIIGIFIAVIGVAIIPLLPYIIKLENDVGYDVTVLYLLYLANTVVTYLFFSYPQTILAANQKQYITANCSLIFAVVTFGTEIVTLLITRNYLAYLSVKLLLGVAQNSCIAIIASRKYPYLHTRKAKHISLAETKDMLKDVYSIFIVKLSEKLFTSTDNLFISVMFGTILVGRNSNYVMIISAITGLVSTCISACSGSVGNLIASTAKKELYSRFKLLDYINFCISGFCGICLYALLNPFISLVWGSDLIFSDFAVAMMCINFYIVTSMSTVFMFREGMGLFRYYIYNQLFAALTNIALNFVLGKLIGLEGVFLATVVANICLAIIPFVKNLFQVGFQMSYAGQVKTMAKRLLLLIGIAVGLNVLCWNIPNTISWFILRAFVVVAVSGIGILLTGVKNRQLGAVLAYAKSIFQRRG